MTVYIYNVFQIMILYIYKYIYYILKELVKSILGLNYDKILKIKINKYTVNVL